MVINIGTVDRKRLVPSSSDRDVKCASQE